MIESVFTYFMKFPLRRRQEEIKEWQKQTDLKEIIRGYRLSNKMFIQSHYDSPEGAIDRKIDKMPYIVGLDYSIVTGEHFLLLGHLCKKNNDAFLVFGSRDEALTVIKRDVIRGYNACFVEINKFNEKETIFKKYH